VAGPVAVVEAPGIKASLTWSRELTLGRRWAIFGTTVVVVIITWVITTPATFIVRAAVKDADLREGGTRPDGPARRRGPG